MEHVLIGFSMYVCVNDLCSNNTVSSWWGSEGHTAMCAGHKFTVRARVLRSGAISGYSTARCVSKCLIACPPCPARACIYGLRTYVALYLTRM